jgi:hypothetical protein
MSSAFSPFLLPGSWRTKLLTAPFVNLMIVLAVLFSPLLTFIFGNSFGYAYPLVAIVGLFRALPSLAKASRSQIVFLLLAAPILALYLFLVTQNRQFTHLFTPEAAVLGLSNIDVYFHTDVANMIQKFGKVSTGLDGFLPIHYYVGSHYWFAAAGRLTSSEPIFTYPFALLITAIPALCLALFSSIICMARATKQSVVWQMALIIIVVLGLEESGLNSYYISESYLFALIFLLMALPLLDDMIQFPSRGGMAGLARLCLAIAFTFIMVSLKISVGFIWGIAVGYVWLRTNSLSIRTLLSLAALALVGLFSIHCFYFIRFSGTSISFYGDYRMRTLSYYKYMGPAAFTSFVLPFSFLVVAWRKNKIINLTHLGECIRNNSMLQAETVFIVSLLAALPTLILYEHDAWYFANIAQWLAFPFFMAALASDADKKPSAIFSAPAARLAFSIILIIALAQMIFTSDQLRTKRRMEDGWRKTELYRQSILKNLEPDGQFSASALASSDTLRCREIIKNAKKTSEGFAVFVPPDNVRFWKMTTLPCAVPFFIPSVTGVPMLKGLPPPYVGCKNKTVSLQEYGQDAISGPWDAQSLCRRAVERKISTVLVLKDLEHPELNETIDCAGIRGGPPKN